MKTMLITGGLGFIGINAALRFEKDYKVILFDNLSKRAASDNLETYQKRFNVLVGDVSKYEDVMNVFNSYKIDIVIHLAAQTAVTKSILYPQLDFESNALGTFYLLEEIRQRGLDVKFIYASTNKVYGSLDQYKTWDKNKRYESINHFIGIKEEECLDFFTPYGCSKGAGDQYVRDYARIYGMRTYVIRQSCIYGKHQDGTEDQGWVAWFTKQALKKEPITIYGNGFQVRDLLYIDDLIDFYENLITNDIPSDVFNIGGGFDNSVSLMELIDLLNKKLLMDIEISFSEERQGDQKIFISNNSKAERLGWKVKTNIDTGLNKLIEYLK